MCDYSIHAVRTTDAQRDDVMETALLGQSVGFCHAADKTCAVCLKPGTEVVFDDYVKYDRFLFVFPKKTTSKVARFRKINLDHEYWHHDALEFADGKIIKLNDMWTGQRARVLQLPCAGNSPTEVVQDLISEAGWRLRHVESLLG